MAEELSNLDVPESSWQALVLAAARDRLVKKAKPKVLAEGWAVIRKDDEITIKFVRGDALFPLSVFDDVDEAVCSLGDNQCGRIVKVQIVKAPS